MLQRAHEFIFKVTRCRRLPLTFRETDLSGLGFGYRQRGNAVGRTQRLDQLSLKVRRPYARRYKKYPMKQTPMR